jgi:2-methylisocitrate lyase-like PEP mutase family enzyme
MIFQTVSRNQCSLGTKMANTVEQGLTPVLPPDELQRIGYSIAAYPLTLLQKIITAVEKALVDLAAGSHPSPLAA